MNWPVVILQITAYGEDGAATSQVWHVLDDQAEHLRDYLGAPLADVLMPTQLSELPPDCVFMMHETA